MTGRCLGALAFACRRGLPMLVAVLMLTGAAAAARADTTTINFDSPVDNPGDITTQYSHVDGGDRGITFQPTGAPDPPGQGNVPKIRAYGPGATSPPNILDTSGCSGEFCFPYIAAKFSDPRSSVSLYPGDWSSTPESATVTVTAYDSAGSELDSKSQYVNSNPGTGPFALCNFDCPIAINHAGIRYISIQVKYGDGGHHVGIDDLSFDRPAVVTPSYTPLWSQRQDGGGSPVPSVGLRQGFSATTAINLDRVAFSGPVTFSISGLPAGISASFDPSSTSGDSTTLRLNAQSDAPSFDGNVMVTATADPGGPPPRSVPVPITVRPNFGVSGDPSYSVPAPTLDVPPCTPVSTDLQLFAPAAFGGPDPGFVPVRDSGPAALRTGDPPAGVSVGLSPTNATLSGASAPFSLSVVAGPGSLTGDFLLPVTGHKSPYADTTGGVKLHPVGARVDGFSPDIGLTPQRLQPGTLIRITGQGFCPGTTVDFGNSAASAPAQSIDPSGTSLTVRVPRLATTGPLTVHSGGTLGSSAASLLVNSYRNTNGFAFTNYSRSLTFDDLTELYGETQTKESLTVDLCWPFGCDVTVFTKHNSYADSVIDSNPGAGLCYGMALTSMKLAHHDMSWSYSYDPTLPSEVWAFTGPAAPSAKLDHAIGLQHLVQFSNEAHGSRANGGDGGAIRARVTSALTGAGGAIMEMRAAGAGHAVTAYDVEDDPSAPGAFYIDVYDSNIPYQSAETTNAAAHRTRVENSRIHVAADGGWSFPNLGWSGDSGSLWTLPYNAVAGSSLHLAKDWFGEIFSAAAPGERVLAITRGRSGRSLIDANGDSRDPSVVRDAVLDPAGPPPWRYVLRGVGPWSETIAAGHPFTHSVEGHGFVALLSSAGKGTLRVDPSSAGLDWRRSSGARASAAGPTTITVSRGTPGSLRTAVLQTGADGAGLGFRSGGALQVSTPGSRGATVTLTLRADGSGPHGAPNEPLVLGPFRVQRGAPVTVSVNWRKLAAGATLRWREHGKPMRRYLADRLPAPTLGHLAAVALHGHGNRRKLSVRTVLRRLGKGSTLNIAWAVLRGHRVITVHVLRVNSPHAGPRTDVFAVTLPPGAGLRLMVGVVLSSGGSTPTVSALRRMVRVR